MYYEHAPIELYEFNTLDLESRAYSGNDNIYGLLNLVTEPPPHEVYELAAEFTIKETVNTSSSSWVRGASYYSCDGQSGFFIIKTDKKEYLYSNLPIHIWEGFKNADSFGSYYDRNIKNKYAFILN